MIIFEEVEHLAKLARIGMTDDEKRELQKDLERILDYVSEIKEVSDSTSSPQAEKSEVVISEHRNVMRDDEQPHETGMYTEDILNLAPARAGNYIKVKKVLKEGR